MEENRISIAQYVSGSDFPFLIQSGTVRAYRDHGHDFTEMCIILAGTGIHRINGRIFKFKTGDIYVLQRGDVHGFERARRMSFVNIAFDPAHLLRFNHHIGKLPGFHVLFRIAPNMPDEAPRRFGVNLSSDALMSLKKQLARIARESRDQQPGFESMITALFMEMVVFVCRVYSPAADESGKDVLSGRLARTAAYMEDAFYKPLTLQLLAERAGVSSAHWVRLFKQYYGITPMEHVIELRLRRACQLLAVTRMPVTEIALACGYGDSNYFTRLFKKRIGSTPRQYRSCNGKVQGACPAAWESQSI